MNVIKRDITEEFLTSLSEYPVVTIIGPRQSGKTTLTTSVLPDYEYCTLEDPDLREFARSDPRSFFKKYNRKVIIDEVQRVPDLLSYIQTLVDKDDEAGRFVLTGSHQLELRAKVSQSLAGRTALLTLLPLSLHELKQNKISLDRDEAIYKGFFPRVYKESLDPTRAMRNYYQTYVEKDVRQLINLKNSSTFESFLKLLAGRVGQVLNLSSLSNNVGKSSTTLKEWLSILEASFIIFKLTPFYENFGKRVIKSPKYYFTDVGLLSYLLGIEKSEQVARDPLLGGLFENLVICEAFKRRLNQGKISNLYFFRDSNGNEVDLLIDEGRTLIPVEIKAARTFHKSFAKGILKFQACTDKAKQGLIVYSGDLSYETDSYCSKRFDDNY